MALDVTRIVDELCALTGSDPGDVHSFVLTAPRGLTVTTFRRNEHGEKYIQDGEPVIDVAVYETSYQP